MPAPRLASRGVTSMAIASPGLMVSFSVELPGQDHADTESALAPAGTSIVAELPVAKSATLAPFSGMLAGAAA